MPPMCSHSLPTHRTRHAYLRRILGRTLHTRRQRAHSVRADRTAGRIHVREARARRAKQGG